MKTAPRLVTLVTTLSILAAACGGGDGVGANGTPDTVGTPAGDTQLSVAVASFDLAVGDDARFLVGLFTSGRDLVLGGEVETRFVFLPDGGSDPEEVATTRADFLPVPGKEPDAELTAPTAVSPAEGAGVYETRVDFDRAGIWGVVVTADVEELGTLQGNAQFVVAEEHAVVAPGEPAPLTEGPVVGDDVPPVQIDSRAQGEDAEVPDPGLHDTTVAEAVAAGRPMVVVVATPTYCASQFCGPITDAVEELSHEYGDVAEFIHLEVWKDFNAEELNEAAAAWIQTEAGGNEPWVFFVDGDGIVRNRWDNVLDRAELVAELETL